MLTPELQEGICDLIRKGNRPAEAAGCFGVAPQTYHQWMRLGRNGQSPYADFAVATQSAIADAKEGLVAVMRRAAEADPKHWKAAQAILERFDPKPLQGGAALMQSSPSAAHIDDEAFWARFEKDTAARVALIEERRRILTERKRQEAPELPPATASHGG